MPSYEILGSERTYSAVRGREGKLDRIVTYRGDDQVLRFVVVPDESYTLAAAQAEITKAETERRLQQPIKFSTP